MPQRASRPRPEIELREAEAAVRELALRDREWLSLAVPLVKEVERRRVHPFFNWRPDDHPERNQLGFHKSQAPIRIVFGGNQCTSLDTWVPTRRGMLRAVDVEVGDELPTGTVIKKWISPGPVPTWKLDLEGGFSLTANAEHPVMTPSGWQTVADIADGEEVRLEYGSQLWSKSRLTPGDAYFLGLMIGDGGLTHHHGVMDFSAQDPELREWVTGYLKKWGIEPKVDGSGIRWCSQALKEKFVYEWGCPIVKGPQKTIPAEVWKDREVAKQFLRGYTDTDGCVYKKGATKDRAVIWISASRELLEQTQQLLLAFGVYSVLSYVEKTLGPKKFDQWRLRARGPAADRFMTDIGTGLARKSEGFPLYEPPEETFRWLKVRDKLYCHEKFVVGLTVEPSNTYVTNGILSHNSGKSRCAAHEAAWLLTEKHPYQAIRKAPRIFAISAGYQTLDEGLYRHLDAILPEWTIWKRGPQLPNYRLPAWLEMKNGGRIRFFSAEGAEESRRVLQAAEIDYVFIDEEVDGSLWKELQARRLARGGRVVITTTLVRSEPWLLELEDRAEAGDPSVDLFRFSTYRARDVGHVDAGVVKEMEENLPEEERDVRLRGHSLRRHGLVFPRFNREHVVEPFDIPRDWSRFMAIDPGFRVCAGAWLAVAPDGKIVMYREMYLRGADWTEVANHILMAEGWAKNPDTGNWSEVPTTERIACRYIDPSSFATGEGAQVKLGILLQRDPFRIICCPAQNDVDAGIERVRLALQRDLDGTPQFRVFRTCVEFQREIRRYRFTQDSGASKRDEGKAKPIKRDDHLLDAVRYALLSGISHRKSADTFAYERHDGIPVGVVTQQRDLDRAFEEEWKELIYEHQHGARFQTPHPAGLGSEY